MAISKELYEAVMERAGGRCEIDFCTTKRPKLEVAHLLGKQAGGSKFRDDMQNLMVLCRLHHDILDGRVDPRTSMFSYRGEIEQFYRAHIGREWKGRR